MNVLPQMREGIPVHQSWCTGTQVTGISSGRKKYIKANFGEFADST